MLLGNSGIDYVIRVFHDSAAGDKDSVSWDGPGNQSGLFQWTGDWTALGGNSGGHVQEYRQRRKTLEWDVSKFLAGSFRFAGATDTYTCRDDDDGTKTRWI